MRVINIGCGKHLMESAENYDIHCSSPRVTYGDATNLHMIRNKCVDKIFMLNPYGYHVLDSDAKRILKKGGYLIITGTLYNRYFKQVWNASQEELRLNKFSLVSKSTTVNNALLMGYQSDGIKEIPLKQLKQVVLVKEHSC